MVTVEDVQAVYGEKPPALDETKQQALLDDAETEADTIYSRRTTRTPILAGDRDIFIKHLAAHKWELAEGGELQSQSQTGGSVNFQTSPGTDDRGFLHGTRFATEANRHLSGEQSTSIIRSDF